MSDDADTPHLDELVRRMRLDGGSIGVEPGGRGSARIVWHVPDLDHPVVLLVRERDLASAVTALGEDCRDALWPSDSIATAGRTLLLVHLDEVVATRDTSEPLRVSARGLDWPSAGPP
ncbi:hypothetical protein GB931_04130 [Modestobacter sp. I12A-02628]|uniref:Uncharacterized protein n=1 Tax=Goekera deserti TaxID=2497753 RepID=A0A7K3WLB5_9ACTN|nr:hypothetical protein [Goekera deserti]MPQ97125.1 hypothetical protein [Goekera deserti]NDI46557.1 hypothetical protein [Goekera deserti]NEL56313.1 hypothetical protein [Goekera deserti]